MAMLAEPRQRKRYNLIPRGKALYEDDSRFGTKMLEKMGWEKGKGLGAKEDGSKDFVRIRYKNDILGLGFEHRDDQWTQHEQSFNGLLKTLNNEVVDGDVNKKQYNGNESEAEDMPRMGFGFQDSSVNEEKKPKVEKLKEKISGISLEERSKQSKARVHYKKFTKGKDLAQYSEKDLANIFGKKAADEQKAANDFYSQLSSSFGKKSEERNDEQENNNDGVNIINTGVSVNDYFKNKMDAKNNRKSCPDGGENSLNMKSETNEEQLEEEELTKKQKKKCKKEKKEKQEEEKNEQEQEKKENTDGLMIYSNVSVTDYFKMKMEAIKNKKNGLNNAEKNVEDAKTNEQEQETEVIKKKKKNKKQPKDLEIEQDNGAIIKEKKSKKRKNNQDQETQNKNEMEKETEEPKKKEKKCKKANSEDVKELLSEKDTKNEKDKTKNNKAQEHILEHIEEVDITNKKLKKRKHKNSLEENSLPPDNTDDTTELVLTQEPNKKLKKKNKTKEPKEIIEIADSDIEEKPLDEKVDSLTQTKKKKLEKSNENLDKESSSSTANQTLNASEQAVNKPKNVKRKDVSAKKAFISDINVQMLDLNELKKKYQDYNIYPISSFCAEKFRNISLNDFTGSILPHIEGYGLDSDLQLDVQINKNDEERITNLWKGILNKYVQLEKPKKTYKHYVKEVINARKRKQRCPKLFIKTWQRKNAFQIV
ncbi:DNA ligase 1 isoform X1 [Lucilia cuprina]|uniref:DNA ligase 1 isoform X1 n=1 Tax=Lucilia cuprina TaxID=7375 RepID=UPI001F066300|nr:DNA ligase 1 isoform X1 [Lucilia cuprina]